MASPPVLSAGSVRGIDGGTIHVSVNGGAVRVRGDALLGPDQQETFAAALVHACRMAGKHDDDPTP